MRKKFLVLITIILIAAFLRLWQLGNVPPSPDWDEAALGYNAYSIMQTNRDEYGKFLPIVLRSFDDYKPALYTYLTIPSVAIFGLNTFAVRLPSAVMGILTVIAVYFLVKELFNNCDGLRSSTKFFAVQNPAGTRPDVTSGLRFVPQKFVDSPAALALISAFLLAVSPWHLQFSRIAFEANIGLTLNVLSILCFLWGLRKPWLLILSAIFASLSLYAYQSEKIFVPLMAIAMIVIYRKDLMQISKKWLFLTIITGLLITLPMIFYLLTDKSALMRARGVSAFADQTQFLQKTSQKLLWDKENHDFLGMILDNRRIQYVLAGFSGYLAHFDFNWLFIHGDELRHHAPGMGLLYLWELPLILIGIYMLIFGEFSRKTKLLIFSWFLIAPIPASITSGVPHAVRTLNFLPTWQIFVGIGLLSCLSFLRKTKIMFPLSSLCFFFFIFNFLYYLNQYFVQQNYFYSQNWQYGWQQAIEEVKKTENNYEKIVVENRSPLDQSYVFFLYYLQYDPRKYQESGGTVSGGFAESHRGFGKYEFRPINWEQEKTGEKVLYVGRPGDLPVNGKIINFLDGTPAIKIVKGL